MWILRNDTKGQLYGLTPGKQHVVSRKDGNILLQDDQSISRKHAQLFVSEEGEGNGILLQDLQSKYGTFTSVGDGELTQLPANQSITLHHNDHVRFGIQWNRWRVEFLPLLVATSTLTLQEKTEVKALVSVLGGQVVSEWDINCTHLTMNKLTVTVKVVCALAAGQPIVTPAYWKSLSQSFNSVQSSLPNCKEFLPPLAEAILDPSKVSFHPDPARAKLFSGITFVAVTPRQMSRIKSMVEAAGGSVAEFSRLSWPEKKLLDEKVVLMQPSGNEKQSSQQSQIPDGYIPLARRMKAHDVRCIPESEIGLSVLFCSLNRYCNPRFNPQTLTGSSSFLEATEPVNVACPNTEEVLHTESSSISTSEPAKTPNTKKRTKEESDSNENSFFKKPKLDSEDVLSSQDIQFQNTENNAKLSVQSSKSLPLKKNTSLENINLSRENKLVLHDPSLDMFASSGRSSKVANVIVFNQSEERPSSEDMFGSRNSKVSNVDKNNENVSVSNLQVKKSKIIFEDNEDEFSFPSRKRSNKPSICNDENDEFSFSANKRCRVQEQLTNENDVFSFKSNKNASNKRSRQSDPDMFASGETSINSSFAAGSSKVSDQSNVEARDEIDFRGSKQIPADDLFSFPKRKRCKESLISANDSSSEVKIALFTKTTTETCAANNCQEIQTELEMDVPEDKNVSVTYSKNMPMPPKLNKEVEDEEVDDLARELHNTTIVLVKPLLVSKPKLVNLTDDSATVKNFKKFRKVIGVKKPILPHIIGGCDLVAHVKDKVDLPNDFRPISSEKQTPDDDWTFLGDKKKGRGR